MKKYKNYLTLAFFLLGTLILLLYVLKWHAVYQEEKLNKSIMGQYVKEIKIEEFKNYINDNRDGVIFFGITDNDYDRKFEMKFKKYIIKYNLQEVITYLNVNSFEEDFKQLMEFYYDKSDLKIEKTTLNEAPLLAIFRDAKLIAFINRKDLTINNISVLFKKYEIIEEFVYVNS